MTSRDIPGLNIIGCGKVGAVLANLWKQQGVFRIGGVVTRSDESATVAVKKVGAGNPVGEIARLPPAACFMLAVPDQQIGQVSEALAESGVAQTGDIVFHLSGALESGLIRESGLDRVGVASVHPLRSFANFTRSRRDFSGTWCGIEGDSETRATLEHAFSAIGGRLFEINPGSKLTYHAASVMVSNYLNALIESGLNCYQLAGIDREVSSQLIEPILRNTCEDIIDNGPLAALTGPIARGDWKIVAREIDKLNAVDPALGKIYQTMGKATLTLAVSGNLLDPQQIEMLEQMLD